MLTIFAFRIIVRPLLRIARSLETLRDLYAADCLTRGIQLRPDKPTRDQTFISYGADEGAEPQYEFDEKG